MFVKFVSFALLGTLGTLAHYSVLYILVEYLHYQPVMASTLGAVAGLIVNYCLNFKWTFKSQQRHRDTFPKFALIALCGMGFNALFMSLLSQHLYYLFAQIITTALVLIWNFLANLAWTFNVDNKTKPVVFTWTGLIKKTSFLTKLLLAVFLFRLITLGLYPLYDPSESRYAEMARKMLETANWVTPMVDYGVPFWGKPPLTIWLTAISMAIGGVNELAARIPSLMLNTAVAGLVYYLVKVQFGTERALAAVLILFSCVLFFVMSGTVAMDLALTFGISLALTGFWLAIQQQGKHWGYVFFIGLAVGLLAKGPITLVLTGCSLGLWLILTNSWLLAWQRIPWFTGILLMLLISAPWYWLAETRTPGFLEYFLIGEHWKRFTEPGWKGDLYGGGRSHPRGMIWLYWLAGGFPWSLLLLRNFKAISLTVFAKDKHWSLFCWLWMLSPLLFFTLSANIIWTYVLPGLPGLAILTADYITENKPKLASLSLIVPVAFFSMVIFYAASDSAFFNQEKLQLENYWQLSSPIDTDFYKSQKRLVETYKQLAKPEEQLIYLKDKLHYSAQFYLQGKTVELADSSALINSMLPTNHDFYLLRLEVLEKFPAEIKTRLEMIKSYGRYQLYHLQPAP